MKLSVSSLTRKEYEIPDDLDDSKAIREFLSLNSGKPVVVVQGLGFVGAVMALVCANSNESDYAVIGVDLPSEASFWKIKSLNEGIFPLIAEDPKIEEFFSASRNETSEIIRNAFWQCFARIAVMFEELRKFL